MAAIDGPALGAGAQLAVAADLRIATADSVIGVPAAKLGLVVDHWTVRRFADEFSPPVARAMLLGAETYTADRLHAIGGMHRLGTLDDALAWADQLAALAPLTIAGHKLALEHRTVVPDPVADGRGGARLSPGRATMRSKVARRSSENGPPTSPAREFDRECRGAILMPSCRICSGGCA